MIKIHCIAAIIGSFFVCFGVAEAQVSISGTAYSNQGVTPVAAGHTITAVVGTSTPSLHRTTTASGGTWTISGIGTSSGGVTWTARTAAQANQWSSVTYGNGTFVAVSSNGTNRVMTSPDGVTWTNRTASQANNWQSVTYGNGLFVAVAYSGTNRVMTSPDGITWTARSAVGNNDNWQSVTYGNGLFVAVANDGGDRVMTSLDGITWTARTAAQANQWSSVTYGNGLFVAVSFEGSVMTSLDGITWTARTAAQANQWSSVTYGNGTFVAVSSNGTNRVMTSPDGITWTARTAAQANQWSSVTYGNGTFVAVSSNGTNRVMTSPDGVAWTNRTAAQANYWTSVTYGNGLFVAVSFDGTNRVMSSSGGFGDLIPITIFIDNASTTPKATTYLMGMNGLSNLTGVPLWGGTVTSMNATTSATSLGTNLDYMTFYDSTDDADILYTAPDSDTIRIEGNFRTTNGVTVGDGTLEVNGDFTQNGSWRAEGSTVRMVGIGGEVSGNLTGSNSLGTLRVASVDNRVGEWTAATATPINFGLSFMPNAGAYGNGVTVIVVSSTTVNGTVHVSADNKTWSTYDIGNNFSWYSVTYGNGLFVAVAPDGTNRVMTSPDGITWTARTAAAANQWSSITYGNGLFVAVSQDGTDRVMTSPDGITWTNRTAAQQNWWTSITYGNGLFVATAINGTNRVMTSPDGITWTARTAAQANSWQSVTYGNGLFVAVSQDGTNRVMTSPDGITWTARAAQANYWTSVTYGNGLFVAARSDVMSPGIITSSDGITWTLSLLGESSDTLSGVVFAGGEFVAYGGNSLSGEGLIYTSVINSTVNLSPAASMTNLVVERGRLALNATTTVAGDLKNAGQIINKSTLILKGDSTRKHSGDVYAKQNAFATPMLGDVVIEGDYSFYGNASTSNLINSTASLNVMPGGTLSILGDFSQYGSLGQYGTIHFAGGGTTVSGSHLGLRELGDVTVSTLSNGKNWMLTPAQSASWGEIEFTNIGGVDQFVAVSNDNTGLVMRSLDGVNWHATSAAVMSQWSGLVTGAGTMVAVASNGTNRVMTSPDGLNWTARSASQANPWMDVAYGNGLFVAVSIGGTNRVMTSPNGTTWTNRTAAEANDWASVTYGNGLFVAVARSGTNRVMTSPDGITWTARSAPTTGTWNSVTYGNGTFVAVAHAGTNRVMTSPDGITWTAQSASANNAWYDITYGNSLFVAVAGSGTNRVMTSPDGITWTAAGTLGDSTQWLSVAYGNGKFASVPYLGVLDTVLVSDSRTTIELGTGDAGIDNLTIGNGTLVLNKKTTVSGNVKNNGTIINNGSLVLEGNSGTVQSSVVGPLLGGGLRSFGDMTVTGKYLIENEIAVDDLSVSSGGQLSLVAPAIEIVGNFTQNGKLRLGGNYRFTGTSTTITGNMSGVNQVSSITNQAAGDGSMWGIANASIASDWYSVVYGNGTFVAVATSGTNRVMTSPDGLNWTARTASQANPWRSVTYGNGLFVAVSSGGTNRVMTSPDGITWTNRTAAAANSWQAVTWGDKIGLFAAVSYEGTIMTSPDGITWTTRTLAEANQWQAVTYGNGRFVAIANSGTNRVMMSLDGVNWTAYPAVSTSNWTDVTYGNGLFVATANSGAHKIMTSPDGITWTARTTPGVYTWIAVAYGNGTFVAVSANATNYVATSPDGITWTLQTPAASNPWRSVTYGNGLFVAVSYSGTNRAMASAGRLTINGDVTATVSLTNDSYRELSFGSSAVTIKGDYTNLGQLNAGTSMVTFAGIGPQVATGTLSGASAFYDLTITNSGTDGNITQAVTFARPVDATRRFTMNPGTSAAFMPAATSTFGSVSIRGNSSSSLAYLRSSTAGQQTLLAVTGSKEVGFVDVKDSRYVSGGSITCNNCVNSGNNTNWTFSYVASGALTLANHTAGQVASLFTGSNVTRGPLFAFRLTPSGESVKVDKIAIAVSGLRDVTDAEVSNIVLWHDADNSKTYTGSDFFVATGTLIYQDNVGTLVFETNFFTVPSAQNYIVTADVQGIMPRHQFTLNLYPTDINALGAASSYQINVTGSVTSRQHIRAGASGGGGQIGGNAPGTTPTTGGGGGGGDEAGAVNEGDNIIADMYFMAPTAAGGVANAWTSPLSALVSDGVRATSNVLNAEQAYHTFNFAIPVSNVVTGIEVKIDASGSTAAGGVWVELSSNNGALFTNAQKGVVFTSTTDVVTVVGAPGDSWGRSWTANDFNNGNFVLKLIAKPTSNTVRVDAISVRVYYQAEGGGGGGGGAI